MLKYCLVAILTFACACAYSQTPSEILEKYYRAVGGIENWISLRTAYVETRSLFLGSNLNAFSASDSDTTIGKCYRVWPDKDLMQSYSDSVLASSVYHVGRKHIFVMGNMQSMDIDTGPYEPHFEFEPVMVRNVISRGKRIQATIKNDVFSIQCFDLRVDTRVDAQELTWHFYFNVEDYLLVAWSNSPFDSETTITKVSNYQRVENLLMAFTEEKYNWGKVFFWSHRTKVDLNVPIDNRLFDYKK